MQKGKLLANGKSSPRTRRRILTRSRDQEKRVARLLGGKTVVGSGSKWFAKSDVTSAELLTECKTTERKSFSVTEEMLRKQREYALREGKIPAMQIDIREEQWVMVPAEDFAEMLEAYRELVIRKVKADRRKR